MLINRKIPCFLATAQLWTDSIFYDIKSVQSRCRLFDGLPDSYFLPTLAVCPLRDIFLLSSLSQIEFSEVGCVFTKTTILSNFCASSCFHMERLEWFGPHSKTQLPCKSFWVPRNFPSLCCRRCWCHFHRMRMKNQHRPAIRCTRRMKTQDWEFYDRICYVCG